MDDQVKVVLRRASDQITGLRRRNEVLQARVDTLDLVGALLHSHRTYSGPGAEVDIAWEIERLLSPATGPVVEGVE